MVHTGSAIGTHTHDSCNNESRCSRVNSTSGTSVTYGQMDARVGALCQPHPVPCQATIQLNTHHPQSEAPILAPSGGIIVSTHTQTHTNTHDIRDKQALYRSNPNVRDLFRDVSRRTDKRTVHGTHSDAYDTHDTHYAKKSNTTATHTHTHVKCDKQALMKEDESSDLIVPHDSKPCETKAKHLSEGRKRTRG